MPKGQVAGGGGGGVPKGGMGVPENKNLKPTSGIELRLLEHPASRPVEYAKSAIHKSDFFENWGPSKPLITERGRLLPTSISRRTHQITTFLSFLSVYKNRLNVLEKPCYRRNEIGNARTT